MTIFDVIERLASHSNEVYESKFGPYIVSSENNQLKIINMGTNKRLGMTDVDLSLRYFKIGGYDTKFKENNKYNLCKTCECKEVKEMTREDIEKELGYKIEIVEKIKI